MSNNIHIFIRSYFSVMHNVYLYNYVDSMFGAKVQIVRHRGKESLGVIAARSLGISKASGPVVIILDAHIEARQGWLEPLLYEISKDPRTLASITLDWMKPQEDGKNTPILYIFVYKT